MNMNISRTFHGISFISDWTKVDWLKMPREIILNHMVPLCSKEQIMAGLAAQRMYPGAKYRSVHNMRAPFWHQCSSEKLGNDAFRGYVTRVLNLSRWCCRQVWHWWWWWWCCLGFWMRQTAMFPLTLSATQWFDRAELLPGRRVAPLRHTQTLARRCSYVSRFGSTKLSRIYGESPWFLRAWEITSRL